MIEKYRQVNRLKGRKDIRVCVRVFLCWADGCGFAGSGSAGWYLELWCFPREEANIKRGSRVRHLIELQGTEQGSLWQHLIFQKTHFPRGYRDQLDRHESQPLDVRAPRSNRPRVSVLWAVMAVTIQTWAGGPKYQPPGQLKSRLLCYFSKINTVFESIEIFCWLLPSFYRLSSRRQVLRLPRGSEQVLRATHVSTIRAITLRLDPRPVLPKHTSCEMLMTKHKYTLSPE